MHEVGVWAGCSQPPLLGLEELRIGAGETRPYDKRLLSDDHDSGVFGYRGAGFEVDGLDYAAGRGRQRVLHLHGFSTQIRSPLLTLSPTLTE